MIVRINTIESTSPLSCGDSVDETQLPAVLVPAEPERPDYAYEKTEVRDRVRGAIESLPPRERRVIALYYYGEVTMKEIGAELGVNESRVSQLHARALGRLRDALGSETSPAAAMQHIRAAVLAFAKKPRMAKATLRDQAADSSVPAAAQPQASNVLDYASASRAARNKSPNRKGLASQRQPVSSRNRSASVPATAPVTKITRRANVGVAAAIAR
jgi:RNA polymerase sigma factor for flagellar operon FliA